MEAISASNSILQSTQAKTENSKAAGAIAADFETFLTLLTTQLKNQDPLKPLASADFVAQLATFSAVEQQVRTNTSLDVIQTLLGGSSSAGLANWIGTKVQVVKDAQFDGSPIDVYLAPAKTADRADLVVFNEAAQEVRRISIGLDADVLSWTGTSELGDLLASGTYRFSLESFLNGELLESHQPPIYDEVIEARLDQGATLLVLGDGSVLAADKVTAIRGN